MSNSIDEIEVLIRYLTKHFSTPQPAERWAMYRIITPVIDFACLGTGFEPYFELTQTSAHGRGQSIDIALMASGLPRVLVEAKGISIRVSHGQIKKYLKPDIIGIVSNGTDWILCREDVAHHLRLWNDELGEVSKECLQNIVKFIAGEASAGEQISVDVDIRPTLRTKKPAKERVAVRQINEVSRITSAVELKNFADQAQKFTEGDNAFLAGFLEIFTVTPEHIEIQIRTTRMTVWDISAAPKQRKIRIEFGKREPSVLVRTPIVEENSVLRDDYANSRHNHHGGMREFRLPDAGRATEFGRELASILFS